MTDAYADQRFNPDVDRQTGYQTRNILTMPVINRDGRVIGVTQAVNKTVGHFVEEDEELLKALSSQIAVALEKRPVVPADRGYEKFPGRGPGQHLNAIITVDPDLKVVMANRAAEFLFQHGLITGRQFPDILGPENGRVLELLARVRETGRAQVDFDVDLTLASGKSMRSISISFPWWTPGKPARAWCWCSRTSPAKKTHQRHPDPVHGQGHRGPAAGRPEPAGFGRRGRQGHLSFSPISGDSPALPKGFPPGRP